MYNFSKTNNFSSNKSKTKIYNKKQPINYQKTGLQLSPWESNDAIQYLTGQIQSELPFRNQDSNRNTSINNKNNQKRSASQHYNKDGKKTQKNQIHQVEPYLNKLQQIIVQRCRSSTLCKKNKSIVVGATQKDKNEQKVVELICPPKQSKQKVYDNPQIKTQQVSPKSNSQKILELSKFSKSPAFRNVVNTTYLTFYDEPCFTPFQKNRKKISNIKKNFYTIQSQSKETKKQSTSFKNFENFLKMKKLQKFQSVSKENQEAQKIIGQSQFMSHSTQKNKREGSQIAQMSQVQGGVIYPQKFDNNKKISKMFQITQIPKDKLNFYIKTQQNDTKNFKTQNVNLFKLQKESECLLRMKSEPISPIKKKSQRLYTTQTVINVKAQQTFHATSPAKLKKMISTNIQKIKLNLKMIRDNERYRKIDKKMLQIQGGKYCQ